MSLLELNSSQEGARKVAECYVGADTSEGYLGGISEDLGFLVSGFESERITIDTSKHTANIYKCMEHGLRVEVEYTDKVSGLDYKATWDFGRDVEYVGLLLDCKIKSIRILGLDQMKGVEVKSSNSMKRFDGDRVDYSKLKLGSKE